MESSIVFLVSSNDFADAIKRTPQVFDRVSTYATNFIKWVNEKDNASLSDICQGDTKSVEIEELLWQESTDDACPVSPTYSLGNRSVSP